LACRFGRKRRHIMGRRWRLLGMAVAAVLVAVGPAAAQQIEDELTLITPVSKFIHDAALKAFADYAKEKWGITVKTNALAAGTPVAYGRIVEWKGRPEVDIFWGGESALFDKLAEQKLMVPLELAKDVWETIPPTIGKPRPIYLKDPKSFWVGTALEPYGLVYHPRLFQRLGVAPPKDWDDLLNPKLKGNIAQCAPTRSSSSHATYEVILQLYGDEKGWDWLKRLGANTGIFTARSRDVPSVVAKGEFAAGFAVPSYMAFEEKLAGFDLKFAAPKTAWITPEPMGVLAGAKHPKAARAFIEFLLTERGQRVFMERGLFPLTPKYRVQGAPGSTAEMAVEFTGGIRSYFDAEVTNIYDDDKAQGRYKEVNEQFRKDIEAVWEDLKKKY
jgi:ABC-type Fe3+ transport system substrate-binding protein